MVDTEILFSNMKSPSHECKMTSWPLTSYSDFPTDQTFHHFHYRDTELDLRRITSGFHGTFAIDEVCKQRTFTLPDTLFRPLFLGLAYAPVVETCFPELSVSFLDFSSWIPLGTFSILLSLYTTGCQCPYSRPSVFCACPLHTSKYCI